jgi:hypothetical protein
MRLRPDCVLTASGRGAKGLRLPVSLRKETGTRSRSARRGDCVLDSAAAGGCLLC